MRLFPQCKGTGPAPAPTSTHDDRSRASSRGCAYVLSLLALSVCVASSAAVARGGGGVPWLRAGFHWRTLKLTHAKITPNYAPSPAVVVRSRRINHSLASLASLLVVWVAHLPDEHTGGIPLLSKLLHITASTRAHAYEQPAGWIYDDGSVVCVRDVEI